TNNTIGGTSSGARNLISGNQIAGIQLAGTGVSGNLVAGNYIGTDAAGTSDLGNAGPGVTISAGAANNTVGGTSAAARNVISGNHNGIDIIGATNNVIQGNYVGTDINGNAVLGNDFLGIVVV